MADSRQVAIAKSLVTLLNGQTWSPAFTAVRKWYVRLDPVDITGLVCSVVPIEEKSEIASRKARLFDFTTDIGFQKKIQTTTAGELDDADCDTVALLADAVADFLNGRRLTDVETVCQEPEIHNVQETLDRRGVLTLVIRVPSKKIA